MAFRDQQLDNEGYRPNVAIVIINQQGQLLWAKRTGKDIWQFPQGGIHAQESVRQAMYREMWEELGLKPYHVQILNRTYEWLHYDVPEQFTQIKRGDKKFHGQKQIWFLLRLRSPDDRINLNASVHPEFDQWRWDSTALLHQVADFKKDVYIQALKQLMPQLELPTLEKRTG